VVGISSDPSSAETGAELAFPFARSFGNTRKNSFASLSSNSGSGNGNEAKGYRNVPSPGPDFVALGLLAPLLVPLFVFVVFVDMDVLQHAEGVVRQNHN